MISEEACNAAVSLHRQGWKNYRISTLKLKKYDVSRVLKRYKETGVADRPRSGRPVEVRTKPIKIRIRWEVKQNPERSLRKMAKELEIGDGCVQRIVKKYLKLEDCCLTGRLLLTF
ncbi:hypothetical protein L596_013027 [Steinernema carpocapsae]|uniref:Paired domain-containing protein n=1 Tax=Steinernema carpocapsae TaxID=34508 RepID=A0A4U5NZ04_STECR|nr:hypothetical protein L596_013027 [Steinernema carpocapsae]